ncbi:Uncharacterized protein TCM_036307 [Theobroma cacao]|uniref:Uncharacterized protein n=1 Tax=Theobroma cacao TaxID=3641 RepID=A0A061FIH1_THECC|nr:Uncharacterized protein TCM_036307 [Theobroma cacao]
MTISTMLADIRESSGRNRVIIWWPSHAYIDHRLWPPSRLTACRRPKGSLDRARSCMRVTLNRSDSRPTLESLNL